MRGSDTTRGEAGALSRRSMLGGLAGIAGVGAIGGSLLPAAPAWAGGGALYNPFSAWNVSFTWLDHLSYSLGGTDYPLAYGTPLRAPAAGTLRTSGGSGEWAAGWVGTAGRRAILTLDMPVTRQLAGQTGEGTGDLAAVVFQHLSAFSADGHYNAGQIIGMSGASASGADYGGDIHLHIHGLTARGTRVDFTKFVNGGSLRLSR